MNKIYLSQYCERGETYFEDICLPAQYGLPEKRFVIVGHKCHDGEIVDFICPKGGFFALFELEERLMEKRKREREVNERCMNVNETQKFIIDVKLIAQEIATYFNIPAES